MSFIEFENVSKTYHMGEVSIQALHDASFTVEKGELWSSSVPPVPVRPRC